MKLSSLLSLMMVGMLPLVSGCGDDGPPTGTVSGRVLIDGAAPPEPVVVNFINSMIGQGGGATTDSEGWYELEQPLHVAEYTVYFSKIVESQGPISTEDERLNIIPREYANEMSSPLKEEVVEGKNTIDFDLP